VSLQPQGHCEGATYMITASPRRPGPPAAAAWRRRARRRARAAGPDADRDPGGAAAAGIFAIAAAWKPTMPNPELCSYIALSRPPCMGRIRPNPAQPEPAARR
jgi:hypothetical protein